MKNYLPGLMLFAILFSSCVGSPTRIREGDAQGVDGRDRERPASPRIEIALVDGTGSYTELMPALNRLHRFAGEELNQGDTFGAFWIKQGIGDSVDFLVKPTTLPIAQRRIGDPAALEGLKIKQSIQTTLADYANARTFKKASRTDLVQAIAYAGRILHVESGEPRERWLLLFTDLEDTETREAALDLNGVHVRVFYVPARNDLNGLDKKISDWKSRFAGAGAASVKIYDVGQSEILSNLLEY